MKICAYKDLYTNVHSNFIHNGQNKNISKALTCVATNLPGSSLPLCILVGTVEECSFPNLLTNGALLLILYTCFLGLLVNFILEI